MLLLDNKEINLTNREAKGAEAIIIKKYNDIKETFKGRFPIVIKYVDSLQSTATTVNSQFSDAKIVPIYPNRPISTTVNISIDGERHTIAYTDTKNWKLNEKTNLRENKLKNIPLNKVGVLEIYGHDADLAFFLLYAHPQVQSEFECVEIKKLHRSAQPDYFYRLVDEQKDAERLVGRERAKSEVVHLIYNVIDAKTLKQLGIKYKVSGIDMLTPAQIQIQLLSIIVSAAENSESFENVYAQFISDYKKLANLDAVNKNPNLATEKEKEFAKEEALQNTVRAGQLEPEFEIEMRQLVDEAIKVGAVKEIGKDSKEASRKFWCYAPKNGAPIGVKIVSIIKPDPKDDLFRILCEDKDVRDAVKLLIGEKKAIG